MFAPGSSTACGGGGSMRQRRDGGGLGSPEANPPECRRTGAGWADMTGARILFVVDAGPRVGGGHLMRSLTLARALEAQGCAVAFIGPPAIADLLDAFAPEVGRLTAASSAPEDLARAVGPEAFEAVVFDHYGL